MIMAVAVLAAEAKYVQPFGWYNRREHDAEPVYPSLQFDVLVLGEVGYDTGAVFDRREQRVSDQSGEAVEEGDADLIAVDDQMVVAFTSDDGTDEALPVSGVGADLLLVASEVKRDPRVGWAHAASVPEHCDTGRAIRCAS